ncbi:MAG: hypothetical protein AAGG07_10835 [Planctomycetota bacterium]
MADQPNGGFAKTFIPGLIVGLIVGAVLGAVLPPFFEAGSTPALSTGSVTGPSGPREEREPDPVFEEQLEEAGSEAEEAVDGAAGEAAEDMLDNAGDPAPETPEPGEG